MFCHGTKRGSLLLISVLMLVVAIVVSGCTGNKPENIPPPEEEEEDLPVEEEGSYISLLTGERIEDEDLILRRPIAVVIDNDPTFGFQSGLDKAAWVYELPVEGGITRFLAFFQHQDAQVVGPIRSTRHYFLDWALEFDAALAHIGYSPQGKEDIPRLGIISLNEFGLPRLYWREPEKRRPHNVYSNTEGLLEELEERGLDTVEPKWELEFLDPDYEPEEPTVNRIRIHYPLGVVEYRFDSAQGAYRRYFRGQPQQDAETGKDILVTNVLVQFIPRPRVIDGEGRLEVNTVGEGEVQVFRLGEKLDASWKKDGRSSQTKFTASNGRAVPLAPGNTWVQIVAEGTRVEIE